MTFGLRCAIVGLLIIAGCSAAAAQTCPSTPSSDYYGNWSACQETVTCYGDWCTAVSGTLDSNTGICGSITESDCATVATATAAFINCVNTAATTLSASCSAGFSPLSSQLMMLDGSTEVYAGSDVEDSCLYTACNSFNATQAGVCVPPNDYTSACVSPSSSEWQITLCGDFSAITSNTTAEDALNGLLSSDLATFLNVASATIVTDQANAGSSATGTFTFSVPVSSANTALNTRITAASDNAAVLVSLTNDEFHALGGVGTLCVKTVGTTPPPTTPAPPTPQPTPEPKNGASLMTSVAQVLVAVVAVLLIA